MYSCIGSTPTVLHIIVISIEINCKPKLLDHAVRTYNIIIVHWGYMACATEGREYVYMTLTFIVNRPLIRSPVCFSIKVHTLTQISRGHSRLSRPPPSLHPNRSFEILGTWFIGCCCINCKLENELVNLFYTFGVFPDVTGNKCEQTMSYLKCILHF